MTVFGAADLCIADHATRQAIRRIKKAARLAAAARTKRESAQRATTR
ncbi:hypothetical protein ACWCXC_31645 [Streptomyces sp. NPDC001515]